MLFIFIFIKDYLIKMMLLCWELNWRYCFDSFIYLFFLVDQVMLGMMKTFYFIFGFLRNNVVLVNSNVSMEVIDSRRKIAATFYFIFTILNFGAYSLP